MRKTMVCRRFSSLALTILLIGMLSPAFGKGLPEPKERWAFLVGVADYLHPENDLLGPRNDIPRMRQLLLKRGFSEDHILVKTDRQATRQGILDGWQWLQKRVQPGDLALFYFSGHGTVLPPAVGSTNSRILRSALVPFDASREADLLPGDLIGAQIDRLATDNVLVVVDACHSGRASRLPFVRTRFIPPARFGIAAARLPSPAVRAREWRLADDAGSVEATNSPATRQKEVYLGASRVDQTAAEDAFLPTKGDSSANPMMGAFTYYLLQEAERPQNGNLTYGELTERVRLALLRRYGREQIREDGSRQPTQEPQFRGANGAAKTIFLNAESGMLVADSPPTVSIDVPLRVGLVGVVSSSLRKQIQSPNIHIVNPQSESSDVLVEVIRTTTGAEPMARLWRARIPLEPCRWRELPAQLSRLQATQVLEHLTPVQTTQIDAARLMANGQRGYIEARIGDTVTFAATAAQSGFLSILAIGADGTLTGQTDMPIRGGETVSLPATAKEPAGIDYVQIFVTDQPIRIVLPTKSSDPQARTPESLARQLAHRLTEHSADGSVRHWTKDYLIVRVRSAERK